MVNPFLSWEDTKDALSVLGHMYEKVSFAYNTNYLQHETGQEANYVNKNLTEN